MRSLIFALFSLCYAAPSTMRPSYVVNARLLVTNWQPFQSFPDRLQQTLQPNLVANVTSALVNDALFDKLTPLSHSEVIIIYPEEFTILSSVGIKMTDVEQIGYNNYIQYTIINLGCIKKAVVEDGNGGGDSTVAAVVEAKARTITNIRKAVEKLYMSKGGVQGGFNATAYSPHITLGFSDGEAAEVQVDKAITMSQCVADAIQGNPADAFS